MTYIVIALVIIMYLLITHSITVNEKLDEIIQILRRHK